MRRGERAAAPASASHPRAAPGHHERRGRGRHPSHVRVPTGQRRGCQGLTGQEGESSVWFLLFIQNFTLEESTKPLISIKPIGHQSF